MRQARKFRLIGLRIDDTMRQARKLRLFGLRCRLEGVGLEDAECMTKTRYC
jgi:hypothetical protein